MKKSQQVRWLAIIWFFCFIPCLYAQNGDFPEADNLKTFFPAESSIIWHETNLLSDQEAVVAVLHQLKNQGNGTELISSYLLQYFNISKNQYQKQWEKEFALASVKLENGLFYNIDKDSSKDIVLNFSSTGITWYAMIFAGTDGSILEPSDDLSCCNDSGPIRLDGEGRISVPWSVYWYESPYHTLGKYYLPYKWQDNQFLPLFHYGTNIFAWQKSFDIAIDGKKRDWPTNTGGCHPIKTKDLVYWRTDQWQGSHDLSGNIAVLWDTQGLYLYINVLDDVVAVADKNKKIWQGDFLELWFDWDLQGDFFQKEMNSDDWQIGIRPKSINTEPSVEILSDNKELKDHKFEINGGLSTSGYWLEMMIAWPSDFRLPPKTEIIGFTISICDMDSEGKPLKSIINNQQDFQWRNPTSFGNLIFLSQGNNG